MHKPLGALLAFALLFVSPGCFSSGGTTYVLFSEGGITYLCAFPTPDTSVGSFDLDFNEQALDTFESGSLTATYWFASQQAAGFRSSVPTGTAISPIDQSIDVFTDNCVTAQSFFDVTINLTGQLVGGGQFNQDFTRRYWVTNQAGSMMPTPAPQQLLEALTGETLTPQMYDSLRMMVPTGVATCNSNPNVTPRIPADPATEIFEMGMAVMDLDQGDIDRSFKSSMPLFPEGTSSWGLTLSGNNSVALQPGRFLFAWMCPQGDVPLNSNDTFYQYGFVFDADGIVGNNYQGQPPFDKDYFDDTDYWVNQTYSPSGGWDLAITGARSGSFTAPNSAIRTITSGKTVIAVIPVSEFDRMDEVHGRFTAFSHDGNFGQTGGPWSGDPTPAVDETRLRFDLSLSF